MQMLFGFIKRGVTKNSLKVHVLSLVNVNQVSIQCNLISLIFAKTICNEKTKRFAINFSSIDVSVINFLFHFSYSSGFLLIILNNALSFIYLYPVYCKVIVG